METRKQNFNITPTQQMISSCTGAVITALFVTPLDVVKIRLQAQQKEFMKHKCFLYCNGLMDHLCYCMNGNGNGQIQAIRPNPHWYRRPGHFNGTVDAFIKIARNEGVASLWSGLPPTLVMAVPATVVYFTIYDQLCDRMRQRAPQYQKSLLIPVLSGSTARVVACTLISPLEFIRTKMQSKKLSYLEIGNAVKDLVHQNGFLSLWRGLGPTILRDVPFSAIYWANYEFLKGWFNQEKPTFWFSFAAGASAGTVAAVLTLPFDVVKTHRQIELGELELLNEKSKQASSTSRMLQKIYNARGIPGLFAGIVPRIIKVAPACAIMISTYEFGKSFFRQYNARKKGREVVC